MADEVRASGGGERGPAAVTAVETAAAAARVREVRAVDVKVDANFSGARRFASSAWRKLRRSTTRTTGLLGQFVAESGKIVPRRLTGVCTPHQRRLSTASSWRAILPCCHLLDGHRKNLPLVVASSCCQRLKTTTNDEFKESSMELILKEDVPSLGPKGDVVKVAEGFGRNYLLPQKLAIVATGQQGRDRADEGCRCAPFGEREGAGGRVGEAVRWAFGFVHPPFGRERSALRFGDLGRHR